MTDAANPPTNAARKVTSADLLAFGWEPVHFKSYPRLYKTLVSFRKARWRFRPLWQQRLANGLPVGKREDELAATGQEALFALDKFTTKRPRKNKVRPRRHRS